jgi:nicotinamide-nucleotide amidase
MLAEILATGEEIRTGALVDSNSAYIAQTLEDAGVEVSRHSCVGDHIDQLTVILQEIAGRADISVVTGGLGPTVDDLSAQAAARAAGVELYLEPAAWASIEEFYRQRNRPLNPSVRKQAFLPEGSEMLPNPVGTAPGFRLQIGRCVFFFLPGVPFEMRRMLTDQVLPAIDRIRGRRRVFRLVKTLSCFGLTESLTGERIAGLEEAVSGIGLGLRAKFPEIQVKLYTSGTNALELHERLEKASAWVRERLGDLLFSEAGETMAAVVGRMLQEKEATLAVAESCTGGLISHLLTEVPGSSGYFTLSAVTYANEAKIRVLGVNPQIIERGGAVDADTVKEMAGGIRRLAGARYGLATSGIAGPSGGSADKPVGTVWIGLATPGATYGYRFHYSYGRRAMNKLMFAMKALDVLRRELMGIAHANGNPVSGIAR